MQDLWPIEEGEFPAYASKEGHRMAHVEGFWRLTDRNDNLLGVDQYRSDLAERHGFRIKYD